MIGWLIGIGYPLMTLLASRVAYAHVREDVMPPDPTEGDRYLGGLLAICFGIIWPIQLVCWIVTVKPRPTERELRQQAKERDERIRELERELKIYDQLG